MSHELNYNELIMIEQQTYLSEDVIQATAQHKAS